MFKSETPEKSDLQPIKMCNEALNYLKQTCSENGLCPSYPIKSRGYIDKRVPCTCGKCSPVKKNK